MIAHGPFGFDGPEIIWAIFSSLAFAAFCIFVIVLLVRVARGGASRAMAPQALFILEERYARGEIDRDEFLARRAVLLGEQSDSAD